MGIGMKKGEYIIKSDGQCLEIIDCRTGATSGPLTLGETFEQIIRLFEPGMVPPYPMRPSHEWCKAEPVNGDEFLEVKEAK